MKLYGYYRSSTSYRVRIGLHLKDVAFDYAAVNLKNGENRDPSFAAIHVQQTVPLLETDAGILTQSLAILEWLDAQYPEPSFLPSDPQALQLCKALSYAIATELHAPNNVAVLNYLKREFGADQQAIERWNAEWNLRTLRPVEAQLEASDWLSKDLPFGAPSLFEIMLIPQLYNARRWKVDLSDFPLLNQVDAVCADHPAFQKAHPDKQPDAVETA